MEIPTVTVQREKSEDNPTGLVIINKADLVEGDVVVGAEPEAVTPAADPAASVVTPAQTTETPAATEEVKPWAKK